MTKSDKLFRTKIEAFLHDPIQKPLTLMRTSETHEAIAKRLSDYLGISEVKNSALIKRADWIASSVDRLDIKDESVSTKENEIEVRSPFCESKLELGKLETEEIPKLNQAIEEVFQEIGSVHTDKELYWLLWRSLNDKVKAKLENKGFAELSKKWELIPADTRIPDHSLWNHLKTTMAFAPCMETKDKPAFLLFTIGPVQSFISTARKTQDLWMGSFILSYLSFRAMESVFSEFGADSIVFPELLEQPLMDWWLKKEFKDIFASLPLNEEELKTPTLSNKFLAILPNSQVEEVAKKCKEAVKTAFEEIVEFVKTKNDFLNYTEFLACLWEEQKNDFLEMFYVVLPWEKTGEELIEIWKDFEPEKSEYYTELLKAKNYESAESKLGLVYGLYHNFCEKALGSRKSLRNFEQKKENSFKCSLCGEREALHEDEKDGNKSTKKFWEQLAFSDRKNFKKSEMLCSICVSKRLALDFFKEKFGFKTSFPSTHEIAFTNVKKEISEKDFSQLLGNIKNLGERKIIANSTTVPKLKLKNEFLSNLNAEFLDLNFYTKKNFEEEGLNWNTELVGKIKKDLKKLKETTPYYAVLAMDGDKMGEWLSGERTLEWQNSVHSVVLEQMKDNKNFNEVLKGKRVVTASYHGMISTALKNFALHLVREVVEKQHYGKLIYSGGDDVLAFLPLSEFFEVMRKLRFYFSGNVKILQHSDKGYKELLAKGEKFKVGKSYGNSWVELDGKILQTLGHNATASVGVAIAHQRTNLAYVLREARSAEKLAKNSGRNKFAIKVLKRSGELSTTVQPWNFTEFDTVNDFVKIILNEIKDGKLTNSWIYQLREEKAGFNINNKGKEMIQVEIKRLLAKKERATQEFIEKVEDKFLPLLETYESFKDFEGKEFQNLLSFLETINFVARGGKE